MAKRKKNDPGMAIAERNVQEIQGGYVPVEKGGKTEWVDPGSLSPQEQADVANQSTTVAAKALPPAVRSAVAAENATNAKASSPESAYQQLADTQAQQYLDMTKALDPLTSGASLPVIESTASQNASQMLGASSTSPVSQWLNAQTQAAQAQNVPAGEAQAQVAAAQDQAAGNVATGLRNMGSAEAQMMQAAPYQQLLSSLAADVPYKLLSNFTVPQLMQSTQQAEQALGLVAGKSTNPTVAAPQLPAPSPGALPSNTLSQFQPQGAPQY